MTSDELCLIDEAMFLVRLYETHTISGRLPRDFGQVISTNQVHKDYKCAQQANKAYTRLRNNDIVASEDVGILQDYLKEFINDPQGTLHLG